jgi:GNAT superfamily N-acetyltransferase
MTEYMTGGVALLDRVEPIWLSLREHHIQCSPFFSSELANSEFAERRKELLKKANCGTLHVVIARQQHNDIGYIICSCVEDKGEIDSLFVIASQRGKGIGAELTRRGLAWLDSIHASSIYVNVVFGNDDALKLYSRWGIYPRSINLYRKKNEN